MVIEKISDRNIVFRHRPADWDVCVHLIAAERHNYVIDTGLGTLSVRPVLEYLAGNKKPIIVVNTHFHWDHVWGNAAFSPRAVLAHRLCRETLDARWDEMLDRHRQFSAGGVIKRLPDLTFDGALYFPEDRLRLFYTPGHTADSISVLDEEEHVLNVGDNIGDTMEEIVPDIAVSRPLYEETLRHCQSLGAVTVVSGHNSITDSAVFDRVLQKL